METLKAKITKDEENHFIEINKDESSILIPLTEENPNVIKRSFNELISWAKEGEFQIEMTEPGSDLFSQVANEYLSQLNKEIKEIRKEMVSIGLV